MAGDSQDHLPGVAAARQGRAEPSSGAAGATGGAAPDTGGPRVVLTPDALDQTLAHLKRHDVLHRVQRIGADGSIVLVHEEREDKVEQAKRRARNGFQEG